MCFLTKRGRGERRRTAALEKQGEMKASILVLRTEVDAAFVFADDVCLDANPADGMPAIAQEPRHVFLVIEQLVALRALGVICIVHSRCLKRRQSD